MITVYSGRAGSNIITVKHIDLGKEARRVARNQAQKPGATRSIPDKRRKPPKHKKPLKEEA